MITNALRSLWAEPRAAAVPERLSRDWVLVGVLMVTALLEGVFRDDVAWRPFATIVAVGLAPVLLWRRTRPLACVVVGFDTDENPIRSTMPVSSRVSYSGSRRTA